MQTRLLKNNEIQYVKNLWDYCFEKSYDAFFTWYFENYVKAENIYGAFIGKDFAGMIHLNPYTISLNGQKLPTTYYVGVSTAPQHRHKGVMRALLEGSFRLLKERGQSVAILMPVMAGIYLPYGFAYCYNKLKYQMPLDELSRVLPITKNYEIICACEKDKKQFTDIYKQYTKKLNGYLLRENSEWDNILGELFTTQREGYAVFAKKGNEYCGYMLYLVKDNIFRIIELVALDEEVKIAFLQYAAQHFSQCQDVFWHAPESDLTYLNFRLNKYYPSIQPFMMGRIIQPDKAVHDLQIPAIKGMRFDIKLTDSLIKENNAVFTLTEEKGRAKMIKSKKQKGQLEMDIGTFAQLCFGAFTASDLFSCGNIKTQDDKCLDLLEKVFVEKDNYINEYF